MECIYKKFRGQNKHWKVEFSEDKIVRISNDSDAVLTLEEANFLRKLKSSHEKLQRRRNTRSQVLSRPRKSDESSDYSSSKEFQKLFETLEESTTSQEEEETVPESPYKPLPDVLMDLKHIVKMKFRDSEEDIDKNEPCNSNTAATRAEQYRKLSEADMHSSEEDFIDTDTTCRGYRSVRQIKKKSDRSKQTKWEFTDEEIRELEVHEEGYFEQRCARGRARLKELRKKRFRKLGKRNEYSDRIQFATLAEVLSERGFSSREVVCCSLCRLLISNDLREESFMSPCNCSEKFVHSKCALLHQRKMIRQKCNDCQKFKTDRIVCRSTASGIESLEELELYKLNKEMTKDRVIRKERTLSYRRLPAEFEQDCFICFDSRNIRQDSLEELDSTISKPCQCHVTAHNECLVESLLENRCCGYCGYRIKFDLIGPKVGYLNNEVGLIAVFLLTSVVSMTFFVAFVVSKYVQFTNHTITMIVHNSCVAIILVLATYSIGLVLRVAKRKSREWNRNSAIVIKSYQPSNTLKDRQTKSKGKCNRKQYEEVPYEENDFNRDL